MRLSKPVFFFCAAAAVAVAAFVGMKLAEWQTAPTSAEASTTPKVDSAADVHPKLEFSPAAIGSAFAEFGRPLVTNLEMVDLDRDGFLDVIY